VRRPVAWRPTRAPRWGAPRGAERFRSSFRIMAILTDAAAAVNN